MKRDLSLALPLMNAAGFLGLSPDPRSGVDLSRLGVFVTNPISRQPRAPARERCCLKFPGGFLLHTGHPNLGFSTVLRRHAAAWARSPLPVIVHLLAGKLGEIAEMARRLESVEGVMGIELGFPDNTTESEVWALTQEAAGEMPVIARLPLEAAPRLAAAALEAGAMAVSLAAPRGAIVVGAGLVEFGSDSPDQPDPPLPAEFGSDSPDQPDPPLRNGRLYGPSVFPLALRVVEEMARAGAPVIAAGGVYSQRDVETFLKAGALAVQVDGALWRGDFSELSAPTNTPR